VPGQDFRRGRTGRAHIVGHLRGDGRGVPFGRVGDRQPWHSSRLAGVTTLHKAADSLRVKCWKGHWIDRSPGEIAAAA
jgi:hypothetical protein